MHVPEENRFTGRSYRRSIRIVTVRQEEGFRDGRCPGAELNELAIPLPPLC